MKKSALTLIALGLAGLSQTTFATDNSNTDMNNLKLIQRGAYLADLGDCEGCHTVANGQVYGGGRAFKTPMGTIYSTNISSSKKHGIGNYTYEDFVNAVQKGVAPIGNLYPAMPYVSYSKLTPEDMKALYAYFMHTKPVDQANRENDLTFPADIRFGLKFWNMLEFKDQPFQNDPKKSATWNRGRYLVEGLGHCGECHTPRNFIMGSENNKALQGAVVDGVNAPDLTTARLKQEGWNKDNLAKFLKDGVSPAGTSFDEMFIVEKHSLTHAKQADVDAIVTYLLDGDNQVKSVNTLTTFTKEDMAMPGYGIYMARCAGCHGNHGEGTPNVAPPLFHNATISNPNIYNTVEVIMNGIPVETYNHLKSYYAMPSYKGRINAQQMTDLINFLHKSLATSNTPATTTNDVQTVINKINN